VQHNGRTVDVGGQWIGPPQRRVNALVREFGLRTYEQNVDGKHVRSGGRERTLRPYAV